MKKKIKKTRFTLVYDSNLYFKDKGFDDKVREVITKHDGSSDGSGMGFGQRDIWAEVPTVNFNLFEKDVKKLDKSVECLINHKD